MDLDPLYSHGVLTVAKDRKAYLRSPKVSYLARPEDLFVPHSVIQRYNLVPGVCIDGEAYKPPPEPEGGDNGSEAREERPAGSESSPYEFAPRPPRGGGPPDRDGDGRNRGRRRRRRRGRGQPSSNAALHKVRSICGLSPEEFQQRIPFDTLTVIDPCRKIDLTTGTDDISLRIIDLLSPIGFGQRGLIVSPPRSGKTILLQKMASAVQRNHPDAYLIVLLVDERPEEVTDMRRKVQGEVVASSNDMPAHNHTDLTEIVLHKAKRLVEAGRDVVIFMDSLTRLGRAYNVQQKGSGRTMSGGVDIRTMEKPKAFFGAARCCEEGGSLTIMATALIQTGSRMDELIFEEFKGTGNMELVLNRDLANRRIWPAMDVNSSGTRKEEKLIQPDQLERTYLLRRALDRLKPTEAVSLLIEKMQKTETNAQFLESLNVDY